MSEIKKITYERKTLKNKQNKKTERKIWVRQAIVKGWELTDFVLRLS